MVRSFVRLALALLLIVIAGCQVVKPGAKKPFVLAPSDIYVRLKLVDGKWWFFKGDKQFLSLGVNCVLPEDRSNMRDPQRYNVLSRHNNDPRQWASDTVTRLWKWKFTTVAAWSSDVMYTNTSMYHSRVINFGEWGQNDSRLIDVFSDRYAQEIDREAAKSVAPHASNTYLIGYFISNELPWYGERGWPTSQKISLLTRYLKLSTNAPGKHKAIAFLKDYYKNDPKAFAAEWVTEAQSFDDLLTNSIIEPRAPTAKLAVAKWAGLVADQYFKLCTEAVHTYDPNHLILGCRFAQRAYVPVMEACGRYCDVVSVNHYSKSGEFNTAMVGNISALTGKPILITEFSWRAMDNRSGLQNNSGADVTVATQKDRASAFRRYATTALEQPYLVGYDWFQYADQPPMGRGFDGENSNYGLVDIHDEPYDDLVKVIREINAQATMLHQNSTVAMPAYQPDVLADYRPVTVRGAGTRLPAPVVFGDSRSKRHTYGDTGAGSTIEDKVTQAKTIALTVNTKRGWGCGIGFKPANGTTNTDGSAKLLGGSRIVLRLKATEGVKFSIALNESGHGDTGSQAFDGFQFSDGESYSHGQVSTTDGWQEYSFELKDFERSPHYGNQRGNGVIDMHAVAEICINFAGPMTAPATVEVEWIKVM